MNHWQGKWALITGASAGIGAALARELAAGGTNLVLTARRRDRLAGLAGELSLKHGIRTLVCVADLARSSGPEEIFTFTEAKNITVDLLVNNAGFGAYGEFHKVLVDRLLEMVQVNVSAVVHLTHLYLPGMIARGSGDILILASTAAFQPVPYITTYAATKSFDLQFAEGLAEEVRHHGISVCALCPGSTESRSCRPAPPHEASTGDGRESRSRGPPCACGREEFGDLRIHQLAGRPKCAVCPAPNGHAHRGRIVPP